MLLMLMSNVHKRSMFVKTWVKIISGEIESQSMFIHEVSSKENWEFSATPAGHLKGRPLQQGQELG